MKELKDDLSIWRHVPCSWIGKLNIVKMSVLPRLLNAVPIKILAKNFINTDSYILKYDWKENHDICKQEPQRTKKILTKEESFFPKLGCTKYL